MRDAVGLYKILERAGADGIGDVYRARDTKHGRTVKLRIVGEALARDVNGREQLLTAARRAAAVSHPFVAALYEIGEENGTYYLASEFVPGETLKAVIAGRQLNARRAAELAVQVADALAEIHGHGLVHGAIGPDTVVVTPKGQAKLLDTGLAAWTHTAAPLADDPRQDIAALGYVLYETLTGHVPDPAKPAPAGVMKAIPNEFDPIMLKVLSRDANDNYQSAAMLAADLREVVAILGERRNQKADTPPLKAGRQGSMAPRGPQPGSKNGALGWIATLIILGVLLALVWAATRMS